MIKLNGTPINITMFSDHTSQVWKLPENLLNSTNWCNITWQFENEGEIMHLAQLKCLLFNNDIEATLILPYLPYARQDKKVSNSTTFALSVFAHIINDMGFKKIIIDDPHSHIALELIKNSYAAYPIKEINEVFKLTRSDLVCYPDKGALTKYTEVYEYPYVYGEKVRDQLTGNIISYQVVGDSKDKNVLICDDLVDGGATFKILAEYLLGNGAKEVNLFTTHGIFSKGLKTLTDSGITGIFTKNGKVSEVNGELVYDPLY